MDRLKQECDWWTDLSRTVIGGQTYYQSFEGLLVIDAIEPLRGRDANVSDVHVEPAGRGYECVFRECVYVWMCVCVVQG